LAKHVESTPIKEVFRGETVWEGVVETFVLSLNPNAKRCYAWSYKQNGETLYVTVLHASPVDSPQAAVKAAIMEQVKKSEMPPKSTPGYDNPFFD
jgi:hypothetical protein